MAYLKGTEWEIVEEGFHLQKSECSESIFSLANEHLGVRGYFDEGGSLPTTRGCYVGHVYEELDIPAYIRYRGVVGKSQYIATVADLFCLSLSAAGETLDLGVSKYANFIRKLDIHTGCMVRIFTWKTEAMGDVELRFERLLEMDDPRFAHQKLTLTTQNAGVLTLQWGINATVGSTFDLVSRWIETGRTQDELLLCTADKERQIRYRLYAADGESQNADRYLGRRYRLTLQTGQTVRVERVVGVTCCDTAKDTPPPLPENVLSFSEALQANRQHYQCFWAQEDITIAGNLSDQQGIRFGLFQLHQTYRGQDTRHNIGAKGLSGDVYNGAAFWDTETFCLPYYLLCKPEAAKKLLLFRYQTLAQAKERAHALDLEGACFPVATVNGEEANYLWQHASLQLQPSMAVAYGIERYTQATGDTAFLYREGVEMLLEICRYLAFRGAYSAKESSFGFYGVMGADEFHLMVHNNAFLNVWGKYIFVTL